MRDVGFGLLDIEHADLADLVISRPGGWKTRLGPDGDDGAKLTGQIGVKHEERAAHRCGGRYPPYSQHRSTQEASPREPFTCDFRRFGSSTMQDFILLRCQR